MVPKFRAWDKKTKEYFHISELWNSGTNPECFNFDGWTDNFGNKGRLKDIVIEQFTGLKDADGKEIYVGDIVHVITEDGYERTGKVIFENGCYWVDNGMDKYPVNRIGFERYTLEVLGNVHVNPNIIDFYDMKQL
ncbi:YopX family protein [Levilactobacillus brevis]